MSTAGIYGAVIVNAPTACTSASYTTSTAAVSLGTTRPRSVLFSVSAASCIVFGKSDVGAATTASTRLEANTPYVFNTTSATTHFRIISFDGSSATYWFSAVA